jgi:2-oxoglutarate ferredoxin oxidoreductase subunit beta
MFYPGAFDDGNPRKGGAFELVDETSRDMSSTAEAMALAEETEIAPPGKFGVYLEAHRPTKNELENQWLEDARSKVADLSQRDLLRQRFAAMR